MDQGRKTGRMKQVKKLYKEIKEKIRKTWKMQTQQPGRRKEESNKLGTEGSDEQTNEGGN